MFELLICLSLFCGDPERTLDQQLIVACHKVDVDEVVRCLRKGANVNSEYGIKAHFEPAFENPWQLDFGDIGRDDWTPLLALSASHEFPDPSEPEKVKKDPELRRAMQKLIPKDVVERRRANELIVLKILLSHRCDLEANSLGATALFFSSAQGRTGMVKALLKAGANPNVKRVAHTNAVTGLSPLHVGFSYKDIRQELLNSGADPFAKDTAGRKPGEFNDSEPGE